MNNPRPAWAGDTVKWKTEITFYWKERLLILIGKPVYCAVHIAVEHPTGNKEIFRNEIKVGQEP